MNTHIKNMLVGIFVLAGISLLVSTVLFLKPHVGDGKQALYVRFSDMNKINVGTRVAFAGRPVGEVVAIEEIHDARAQPTDELGRVYFYQVTLHIDSKIRVYNTDEISMQTSGLLGEKSIAIVPKAPPLGVTPKLLTDQPIYAESVDPLANAMVEFSELASNMEEAFKEVAGWIKNNGEGLASAIQSFGSASNEISQTVASVNEKQIVSQVQEIFGQVKTAMNQLEEKETFTNLAASVDSIKKISSEIAEGKGTVGKLLHNEDLYLSTNAIMSKINTLMNDVNHYGVLFHLNKRWQRIRTQRVDMQNALSSPDNFRTYFQTEIDDINTAMERISMVVDRAGDSEGFKRDFAELLRQSNQLSDNLRLYNQQLLDLKGK